MSTPSIIDLAIADFSCSLCSADCFACTLLVRRPSSCALCTPLSGITQQVICVTAQAQQQLLRRWYDCSSFVALSDMRYSVILIFSPAQVWLTAPQPLSALLPPSEHAPCPRASPQAGPPCHHGALSGALCPDVSMRWYQNISVAERQRALQQCHEAHPASVVSDNPCCAARSLSTSNLFKS